MKSSFTPLALEGLCWVSMYRVDSSSSSSSCRETCQEVLGGSVKLFLPGRCGRNVGGRRDEFLAGIFIHPWHIVWSRGRTLSSRFSNRILLQNDRSFVSEPITTIDIHWILCFGGYNEMANTYLINLNWISVCVCWSFFSVNDILNHASTQLLKVLAKTTVEEAPMICPDKN